MTARSRARCSRSGAGTAAGGGAFATRGGWATACAFAAFDVILEGGDVPVLRRYGHGEIADDAAEKGDLAGHLGDRGGQAGGGPVRLGEARLEAKEARRQRVHLARHFFGPTAQHGRSDRRH